MCLPVVGKSDSGSEVMKTDRNTWAEKGRETDRKTETKTEREQRGREMEEKRESTEKWQAETEKSPLSLPK